MQTRFRVVFVDRVLSDDPLTRDILANFGASSRLIWVEGREEVRKTVEGWKDPIGRGKRTLYLTRHKGEFFKDCPGSPGQVCCGYKILNIFNNCPFDCSYCILQSYLSFEPITVYVNVEDAARELESKTAKQPERLFRVGTGELGDSLALETRIPLSRRLIPLISRLDNVILELKTKSADVGDLLDLAHGRKVILSWSLAPERVVEKNEPGTGGLAERIEAAGRAGEEGYLLGFHFDPIIRYRGWEDDYRGLLDRLFTTVDQRSTVWISLGCLRFPPNLKEVAFERRRGVGIFLDEFVPCPDGKMRYLRTIREEIYGKMLEWLRERAPLTEVYMCMESPLMWENVFGQKPDGERWLSDRLDRAVLRKTGSVMSACAWDGQCSCCGGTAPPKST